jgi:hypothetical protein
MTGSALKLEEKKAITESENALIALKAITDAWDKRLEPQKQAVMIISGRIQQLESHGKKKDAERLASVLGMFVGSIEALDATRELRSPENKEIADNATRGIRTYALKMSEGDERAAKFAMGIAMSLQQFSKAVSGENDESASFKKALSAYAKGDLEAGNRFLDDGMGSFFDKDIQRLATLVNVSDIHNQARKLMQDRYLHFAGTKPDREKFEKELQKDPAYMLLQRISDETNAYRKTLEMTQTLAPEQMEAHELRVAGWSLAMVLLNRANDGLVSQAEECSNLSGSDKKRMVDKFKDNAKGFIAAAKDALDSAPKLERSAFKKKMDDTVTYLFEERVNIISNWEKFPQDDALRKDLLAIASVQRNMTLILASPSNPVFEQTVPRSAEINYNRMLAAFFHVSDAGMRRAIYTHSAESFSIARELLVARGQRYTDLVSMNRTKNNTLDLQVNRNVKASEAFSSLKTGVNLGISMLIPIYGIAYMAYNIREGYQETGKVDKTQLALTVAGAIPVIGPSARLAARGSRWAKLVGLAEKGVGYTGLAAGSVIGGVDAYAQYQAGKGVDAIMNSFVLLFPVAHMIPRMVRARATVVPERRVRPNKALETRAPAEAPPGWDAYWRKTRSEMGGGGADLEAAERAVLEQALAKRSGKQQLSPQEAAALRTYDATQAKARGAEKPAAPEEAEPAEATLVDAGKPVAAERPARKAAAPARRVETAAEEGLVPKPIPPQEPDYSKLPRNQRAAAKADYKKRMEKYVEELPKYHEQEAKLERGRQEAMKTLLQPLEKTSTEIVGRADANDPASADSQDSIGIIKALYHSAVELGKKKGERSAPSTTLDRIYSRKNIQELMDATGKTDPEILTIKRFILAARNEMAGKMRKSGKRVDLAESDRTTAGQRLDSGDVASINEALIRESIRNKTQSRNPRNPLEAIEDVFGPLSPEQREPLIRTYVSKGILPEAVFQQVFNDHVNRAKASLVDEGEGQAITAIKRGLAEKLENPEHVTGTSESELLSALKTPEVEQAVETQISAAAKEEFIKNRDSSKNLDEMIEKTRKSDQGRLADALSGLNKGLADDFFYIEKFGNDARRIARETAETSGAYGAKRGIDESVTSRFYRKGLTPLGHAGVAVGRGAKWAVNPSTSPATRLAVRGGRMAIEESRVVRPVEYVAMQAIADLAAYYAIRYAFRKSYDWYEGRVQRELNIQAAGVKQSFPAFTVTRENVEFANSQEGFDFLRKFYKSLPKGITPALGEELKRTDDVFVKSRINEFLDDGRKVSQQLGKINKLFAGAARTDDPEQAKKDSAELDTLLASLKIDRALAEKKYISKFGIQVADIPDLLMGDWKKRFMVVSYGVATADAMLTMMGGSGKFMENGDAQFLARNPDVAVALYGQYRDGYLSGAYLSDAMTNLRMPGLVLDNDTVLKTIKPVLLSQPFSNDSFLGRLEQQMIEQDPKRKEMIKDIIGTFKSIPGAMDAFNAFKPKLPEIDKEGKTIAGEELYGDAKKLAELIAGYKQKTPREILDLAIAKGYIGPIDKTKSAELDKLEKEDLPAKDFIAKAVESKIVEPVKDKEKQLKRHIEEFTKSVLDLAREQGYVGPAILGAMDKRIRGRTDLVAFMNSSKVSDPDGKNGLTRWVTTNRPNMEPEHLCEILDDLKKKDAVSPADFERAAEDKQSINLYKKNGWWKAESPSEKATREATAAAGKSKGAGRMEVKTPEAVQRVTDTGQVYGRIANVEGAGRKDISAQASTSISNAIQGALDNYESKGKVYGVKMSNIVKHFGSKEKMTKAVEEELQRMIFPQKKLSPDENSIVKDWKLNIQGAGDTMKLDINDSSAAKIEAYIGKYLLKQAGPQKGKAKRKK